jgi:catechol 2,3-dioxygenase-like lactoylglutathione lyase family enzyme
LFAEIAMLDHITLIVSDYARAKDFYEKALKPLGYKLLMEYGQAAGMGEGTKPDFWFAAGTPGSISHIALTASDRKTVDAFYKAAMAAGGKDNGKPGIRKEYHPTYYGAFVLDPDGHNIEAVCHKAE